MAGKLHFMSACYARIERHQSKNRPRGIDFDPGRTIPSLQDFTCQSKWRSPGLVLGAAAAHQRGKHRGHLSWKRDFRASFQRLGLTSMGARPPGRLRGEISWPCGRTGLSVVRYLTYRN
jgi:hypothetical protein